MKIRVLIADDHAIVRSGLRLVLQTCDALQIVGEAENGHQAVTLARQLQPDILLLDLHMPGLNGLDAVRELARERHPCKILILSSNSDPNTVRELVACGIRGYLSKQT